MADEPNTPPANPAPTNPPADPTPASGGAPASPPASDAVALAKELGEAKAKLERLEKYQSEVDPVLQTIWADEEALKVVTDKHNKRLGVTPTDPTTPDPTKPPPPSPVEVENRNAHIKSIVDKFSTDKGIDKLDPEAKKEINIKVGAMLQDMLDPKGNKNLQQIMEDVSLTKLPQFLENAYYLATKDSTVAEAIERGKREALGQSVGVMGSIPSSAPNTSEVVLTPTEKETAAKMGIPEDRYLARKKEIASQEGQLY